MPRTVMRWQGDALSGVIEFDAVPLEAPHHEVAITEYPIEVGADLIDHIRPRPFTLRLTGIVTNSPSRTGLTQLDGAVPATEYALRVRQPHLPIPPALVPSTFAGVPLEREVTTIAQIRTWSDSGARVARVQNVYQLLIDSMRAAREFTIAMDLLGDCDRMLIKAIDTERTATTGNGLTIALTLQQVGYAELVRRDVSHLLAKPRPKTKAAEPKQDEGKKDAPAADAQSNSWLYDLWGAVAP